MNSPILVSSGFLTMNANQAVGPDPSRMTNPYKTPMLVDEIRFRTTRVGGNGPGPQLSLLVELKLGRIPLTNGFVPAYALCKQSPATDNNFGTTPSAYVVSTTWKLPKPIYVPYGEYLSFRVMYDPTLTPAYASTTAEVSYAGRSLSSGTQKPASVWIPWATSFPIPLLAQQELTAVSSSTISTQSQLVNPFDDVLYVQRFIGRTWQSQEAQELGPLGGGTPATGVDLAFKYTMVRATDSLGNILVRDPTPFPHLFQFVDRTWNVNTVLPPKGFYIFQVDRDYPAGGVKALAHNITMIGYHELRLM